MEIMPGYEPGLRGSNPLSCTLIQSHKWKCNRLLTVENVGSNPT